MEEVRAGQRRWPPGYERAQTLAPAHGVRLGHRRNDLSRVDGQDLAGGDGGDCVVNPHRNTKRARDIVRGAERQDAKGKAAPGEMRGDRADRAVAPSGDGGAMSGSAPE